MVLQTALSWLGKTYYDASNGRQSFNSYMAGSDVDPYQSLGATRLFLIISTGNGFEMTLAENTSSNAPTTGGTNYPNTDAGITQMYSDLSASPIFSSVNYCYIPARLFSDYDVSAFAAAANLDSGYDPATGLRAIVMGSAVAQAVPLDDFLNTHNEQIYDDSPKIVPLFTALVYDVTQNNQMNAKTFNLPTYYTRDQVSPGNYYVSNAGDQTATFQGGPGYMDVDATALTVQTISQVSSQGKTFTDYNYTTATVATTAPSLGSRVQLGTSSLTYNGASPSTDFANQSIIGFYRDSTWTTCLGIPIYDYGAADSSFTSTTAGPVTPELIYDPTKPFLNGGTLQNVVQKLGSAKYFYSADRLVSILDARDRVEEHAERGRACGDDRRARLRHELDRIRDRYTAACGPGARHRNHCTSSDLQLPRGRRRSGRGECHPGRDDRGDPGCSSRRGGGIEGEYD